VIEEQADLLRAHCGVMPFAGKKDNSLDPMDVSLLRPIAEMAPDNRIPNQLKQARFGSLLGLLSLHDASNVLTHQGDDMFPLQLGGMQTAFSRT
jgi:hypothetical protein